MYTDINQDNSSSNNNNNNINNNNQQLIIYHDNLQVILHNEDLEKLVLYDANNKNIVIRETEQDFDLSKSTSSQMTSRINSLPSPSLTSAAITTTTTTTIKKNSIDSSGSNMVYPLDLIPATVATVTPISASSISGPISNNNVIRNCPFCSRSLPPMLEDGGHKLNNNSSNDDQGMGQSELHQHQHHQRQELSTSIYHRTPVSSTPYISKNYFLLLDSADKESKKKNSSSSSSGGNDPTTPLGGISNEFLNIGYYKKFFRESLKIGSGGFGAVYLCRHFINNIDLGEFAVKKVPVGENIPWLFRVLKEVKALETLTKHRNIINYKHSWLEYDQPADFGPKIPCLYILMEYANNGNLQDFMMEKGGMLSENEIWSFFIDLCHGLGYLHHAGIVHRDIKPQNILIHQSYDSISDRQVTHLMISDFGTCDTINSSFNDRMMKRTGNTGTIEYLAPELLKKNNNGEMSATYTEKCDIWSLGILLYQMAYGTLPYKYAGNPFIDNDPIRNMMYLLDEIENYSDLKCLFPPTPTRSKELKEIIAALLRREPSQRPSISKILLSPFIQSKTKQFTINPLYIQRIIKSTSTTTSSTASKRKNSIKKSNAMNQDKSGTSSNSTGSSIRKSNEIIQEQDDIDITTTSAGNQLITQTKSITSITSTTSEDFLDDDDDILFDRDESIYDDNDDRIKGIVVKQRNQPISPSSKRTNTTLSLPSPPNNANNNNNNSMINNNNNSNNNIFARCNYGIRLLRSLKIVYIFQTIYQVWLCIDQCKSMALPPSSIALYPLLFLSLSPMLVIDHFNYKRNKSNSGSKKPQQQYSKYHSKAQIILVTLRFLWWFLIYTFFTCCDSNSPTSSTHPIASFDSFFFKNLVLYLFSLLIELV
ncbi:hypothetical protein CYY_008744 [Polysphondylium violaceum]|uniref:non-specific serine/threonine protein kinase n=1 Tax=Polysphondylium violaceum TaxID=133409 RepID=A0A8J4PMY7_9MYCE|nr:hypothetical protein CYY_008744 [Polysphondylium violaceum]